MGFIAFAAVRGVDPEGLLAASLSAGIALGAAIDAQTPQTCGRVDQVDHGSGVVKDLHGGDTEIAEFLDASKFGAVARNGGLLVATALETKDWAAKGAVQRDNFIVGVELLHNRLVWVDRSAAHAAETISIFERVEYLFFSNGVLELGTGLASE